MLPSNCLHSFTSRRPNLRAALVLFAGLCYLLNVTSLQAQEPLKPLLKIGPWTAVSGLIGYGSRVWFANSVKFKDHNSADIYSYDPKTGIARYERHLFSQDAGRPTIVNGQLFWPFEDMRFSMGRGEFMVTDGDIWKWRSLSEGRAFHVHTMHHHDGTLYAATGAFHARLFASRDQGLTWRALYQSNDRQGSFSRLISLASLGPDLYAGLYASNEPGIKLSLVRQGKLEPVPGWPRGDETDRLTAYRGHIYAANQLGDNREVWRTDGKNSERIDALQSSFIVAMAADEHAIWAISNEKTGGTLWRSGDGLTWRKIQRFSDDQPVDLTIYAGRPYVGALGADGQGALWGPAAPADTEPAVVPTSPADNPAQADPAELASLLEVLDKALGRPGRLTGRGALRRLIGPIAAQRSREAGLALSQRLKRSAVSGEKSFFAGQTTPIHKKIDWVLLWATAQTGHGRVPLDLLNRPWDTPRRDGEKYAASPPAAAWAIGIIGQKDDATVQALIDRLKTAGDPDWLKGDIVGALTAVTGQRFGYDVQAWTDWWAKKRSIQ